ncbi:MAG: TlpA family protein disulfide reductase [Thermoleophilaceae bacterium]
MSEDRFGDLGPAGGDGGPSAAERLAELDERQLREERERRPPEEDRRPRGRYSWVIGVAFVIVIVVAGVNTLGHGGAGVKGPQPGEALPKFAAPLATGRLNGDANVKQKATDSNQLGDKPACEVRGPGIFNVCDAESKPLVLTFIVTRQAKCAPQLDRIERVRGQFPGVNFVAVVSGDKRKKVAGLVRDHGWRFPVAVDHDGELVNVYGIGVCPTTVFAKRGGTVRVTKLGNLGEQQLAAQVRALQKGS